MSRAPVNAFDAEFVDAWYRVRDEIADSGCAILHLRSPEKVFSAGADLKMMRSLLAGARAGEKLVAHVKRMQDLFNRIKALPVVTLAEISGSALGGGLEFALACDLPVAGHGALLGLPESRIWPDSWCGRCAAAGKVVRNGDRKAHRSWLRHGRWQDGRTNRTCTVVGSGPRALIILRRACSANIAEFGGSGQQTLPGQDRSSIDRGLDAEVQETLHLLETADTQFRVKAFLEGRRAR